VLTRSITQATDGRIAVVGAKDHGVAAVGALLAMGVPAHKIYWLSCSDRRPYDVGHADVRNMSNLII
jgi:hypothetical protein